MQPAPTDTAALLAAHQALTLALDLNLNPALDGKSCRMAFDLARQIIRDAFRDGQTRSRWAGESIIETAISTGEYAVADLARYLAAHRASTVLDPSVTIDGPSEDGWWQWSAPGHGENNGFSSERDARADAITAFAA